MGAHDLAGDRQPEAGATRPVGIVSEACRNGSKMRSRSAGPMPLPVSATETRTSSPDRSTVTLTRPPGLNFAALDSRLITTWTRRSASPLTSGKGSATCTSSAHAADLEQGRRGSGGAADDVLDAQRSHPPLEPAGLDLGQVEQVVDQPGEPLALLHDDAQVVADLPHRAVDPWLGPVDHREHDLVEPPPVEAGEADHRGERRPQLM